jgi:hypothetical protein
MAVQVKSVGGEVISKGSIDAFPCFCGLIQRDREHHEVFLD